MFYKKDSGTGSSEDGDHRPSRSTLTNQSRDNNWNESRNGSGNNSPEIFDRTGSTHPLFHSESLKNFRIANTSSVEAIQTPSASLNINAINKPRIWSLADLASKESKYEAPASKAHSIQATAGKIPLTSRSHHQPHHPYIRPELYRGFYGPTTHLSNPPSDVTLLESYQRSLGASLGYNGMNNVPLKFGPSSFIPSESKENTKTTYNSRHSPSSCASSSPEHSNSNNKQSNK